MRKVWLAWAIVALQVLAGAGARSVWASVVLKPSGQNGVTLRAKKIEARVTIRGGFAEVTSVMTFANETRWRVEADFLSTLPEGATATYFAYWFGEEKVVARIVEKERAATIYRTITQSWSRDPALVEMIGKNTFRARIFPVEANADLRVEMRWVQVLATTPTGLRFAFPLAPEMAGTGVLDAIDLQVAVASNAEIVRASNNYGQAIARRGSGLAVGLRGEQFQPTQDFILNLEQRSAESTLPSLRAQVFAARSSGEDGFFALSLTPNRSVARPKLTIRGVETYDVTYLPALQAGKSAVHPKISSSTC